MNRKLLIPVSVGLMALLLIAFGVFLKPESTAFAQSQSCTDPFTLGQGSFILCQLQDEEPTATETMTEEPVPTETETPVATMENTVVPTDTPEPTATDTETPSPTITSTDIPTLTSTPTSTATPVGTFTPFANAPACVHPDNNTFHTLWNSALGCHYDHEHGTNPFTAQVAAAFAPLGDLQNLLCGLQVSHCVPSSPMENTMKHGGHKWQVTANPNGCTPFTGLQAQAVTGVDYAVIQFHDFGNSFKTDTGIMDEFASRIHSVVGELRQCKPSNPSDKGYVFVEQFQDFGQRLRFYQGPLLPYADNPSPAYATNLGPYFTDGCLGNMTGCRATLAQAQNANANTIWTSQPKNVPGSKLFFQLFRGRDVYELVDAFDNTYPFTSYYLCTSDNGSTYNPSNCRYNNTTSTIHEIGGEIPASWDNLSGFDTNPVIGRITATGFVTRFGTLAPSCTDYGPDCQRIKLVDAFVGKYGAQLINNKLNQFSPEAQPERDICFSSGSVVNCDTPGAVPSGWVGPEN